MPDFTVHGRLDASWTVTADDADEAARLVDAHDAGDPEIDGYGIDKVVGAHKMFDDPDERTYCTREGCGHLAAGHTGLWSSEHQANPHGCDTYMCSCRALITKEPAGAGR